MLTMILTFVASVLPGLGQTLVAGYQAKLTAENTTEKTMADLAGRELAIQTREAELTAQIRIAQIGKWNEPEHLFGYIMVIYFGKIVLYDKVFALGSTDAIHGDAGNWAGMIMAFYFAKRGIENVARILKR